MEVIKDFLKRKKCHVKNKILIAAENENAITIPK